MFIISHECFIPSELDFVNLAEIHQTTHWHRVNCIFWCASCVMELQEQDFIFEGRLPYSHFGGEETEAYRCCLLDKGSDLVSGRVLSF